MFSLLVWLKNWIQSEYFMLEISLKYIEKIFRECKGLLGNKR